MAFAALDHVELVKRRWRTKLKAVLDAACFLPEDRSAPVRKVGIMDKAKPVDLSSPVTFDTTSPEYVADPYPILRRIQETEPLRKTTMGWLVTRYYDTANLLRESRIWGSGMTPERRLAVSGAGPMFEYASRRMNGYNPPEHTRLRSLITKGFTARRIEALRPRIQKLADDLLDSAEGAQEFDVLEVLAHPLPCQVICENDRSPTERLTQPKPMDGSGPFSLGTCRPARPHASRQRSGRRVHVIHQDFSAKASLCAGRRFTQRLDRRRGTVTFQHLT